MPFQNNDYLMFLCHFRRQTITKSLVLEQRLQRLAHQSCELSEVGCHDGSGNQTTEIFRMLRKGIQSVGIHHQRGRLLGAESLQQFMKSLLRSGIASKSRPNADRVIRAQIHDFREKWRAGLVMPHNGLRHRNLHNVIVTAGNVHRQFPNARAQTRPSGKHRRTGHTVCSGNKQGMPEIKL